MNEILRENKIAHVGRRAQTRIYLGKLFRMFIYQNDWKVLPMSAFIAFMVSSVVAKNLYKTMEGTQTGAFAITCICIWNGCFNSIQSICRERAIVKREHRSGLHITSYISAHSIYQAFLCASQTLITMLVMSRSGVDTPTESFCTGSSELDMFITLFLISYTADIISLFISSVVKSTTTAMTVMPFFLIFQLIFSGGFFDLSGILADISDYTVSRWGLNSVCALGNFNELDTVSAWNALSKMRNVEMTDEQMKNVTLLMMKANGADELTVAEVGLLLETAAEDNGEEHVNKPVDVAVAYMEDNEEAKSGFMAQCRQQNFKPEFEAAPENIMKCWFYLIVMCIVFCVLAVISLEFIDRDRR